MSKTLAQQFGALLTAERERRGLSRRGLAEALGVADVTLLAYEHGTANPTLAKAEELAGQYGLEVVLRTRRIPGKATDAARSSG